MTTIKHALPRLALVIACTMLLGIDCGARDCEYDGKVHHNGDSFPSADGCNTCSCANGAIACTEKACAAQWFLSCGDPVCGGYKPDPNVPLCTTQKLGDPCAKTGDRCDPRDSCNAKLVCAVSDPRKQPGGCPISRARHKEDIRYLDDADRARLRDALLETRLATYRYKASPAGSPKRLGFLIDDVLRGDAASPAVSADGETVDLYGYASMTVAAVQAQARELAELRAEVKALRAALAEQRPRRR